MKHFALRAITLAAALLSGVAAAGDISIKADAETCDREIPQDKAALVQASRSGNIITVDVTAQLNCGHVPGKPELREWRSSATVALPTVSPSGAAAMCLCTHRLSFEIKDLYDGVQTIYYVQDGIVLGHAEAP